MSTWAGALGEATLIIFLRCWFHEVDVFKKEYVGAKLRHSL